MRDREADLALDEAAQDRDEEQLRARVSAMSPPEIDRLTLENDRLEQMLHDLANERGELQAAATDAHKAADELRRAARSANEAAGWIANEAAGMRR